MGTEIHVGDVGTEFLAQLLDEQVEPVDVSGATVLKINFLKPDGTTVSFDASPGSVKFPSRTGVDGWFNYRTVEDDLDQQGTWEGQGYVEVGGGKWHTNKFRLLVDSNV
jgi:hypothetical protein